MGNYDNVQDVLNVFKQRKYHYGAGEEEKVQFNLIGSDLANRDLAGIDLVNARLMTADLEYTDLSNANLGRANLQGANLKGANLQGAIFQGTNLLGAEHLTIQQLSKVKTLYGVKNLDHKLKGLVRKYYPHLLENPEKEELK